MQTMITLDSFNIDHDDQANFTIRLIEERTIAGTIRLDYGSPVHKVTMEFTHPFMTVLAQSHALRCCVDMLDTHFAEEAKSKDEWIGDIYLYV